MTLLQTVNATDLYFRITDVALIISGVLSLAGIYFTLRGSLEKVKDDVESKNQLFKQKMEMLDSQVKDYKKLVDGVEHDLQKQMEEMTRSVNELSLNIEKMKNEILTRLLDNKK